MPARKPRYLQFIYLALILIFQFATPVWAWVRRAIG